MPPPRDKRYTNENKATVLRYFSIISLFYVFIIIKLDLIEFKPNYFI